MWLSRSTFPVAFAQASTKRQLKLCMLSVAGRIGGAKSSKLTSQATAQRTRSWRLPVPTSPWCTWVAERALSSSCTKQRWSGRTWIWIVLSCFADATIVWPRQHVEPMCQRGVGYRGLWQLGKFSVWIWRRSRQFPVPVLLGRCFWSSVLPLTEYGAMILTTISHWDSFHVLIQ